MKTIQINLEDKEFEQVNRKKGDLTWREFLLQAEAKTL